jgi:hypothetical protein
LPSKSNVYPVEFATLTLANGRPTMVVLRGEEVADILKQVWVYSVDIIIISYIIN